MWVFTVYRFADIVYSSSTYATSILLLHEWHIDNTDKLKDND